MARKPDPGAIERYLARPRKSLQSASERGHGKTRVELQTEPLNAYASNIGVIGMVSREPRQKLTVEMAKFDAEMASTEPAAVRRVAPSRSAKLFAVSFPNARSRAKTVRFT